VIQGRVEEISNLDFSKSLDIKTGDELESLAGDINELSEKLESSLEDLKLKNIQLEKDIIAQKRFIANASHELRTPLALIKGYTEELSSGFVKNKEQQELYLGIISDESTKIKRLINEMLDLSRLESGRMELKPEEFMIKDRLLEFLDKYSGFISDNGLDISLDSDENTKCSYDPMRFEQILANFLSNAAKYSDGRKKVLISTEQDNDFVKINFFNSGKPIDGSIIEHIWDGFYKDPNSFKNERDSFGLGLSIIRAIQDVAGCGYGVKNEEDGVTFWFSVHSA
jgi:signal transduction histidine kinase